MSEIVATEDTLHGKPRVKRTRVAAETLYELHILKGMSVKQISGQYPSITVEDVEAAVEYVENRESEDRASAIA